MIDSVPCCQRTISLYNPVIQCQGHLHISERTAARGPSIHINTTLVKRQVRTRQSTLEVLTLCILRVFIHSLLFSGKYKRNHILKEDGFLQFLVWILQVSLYTIIWCTCNRPEVLPSTYESGVKGCQPVTPHYTCLKDRGVHLRVTYKNS